MKSMIIILGFLGLFLSCVSEPAGKAEVEKLAFPEAQGFGKHTTGGRGGKVLIVSNLNDAGPGSLRAAIEEDYPRIVVFSVSGTIALKSSIWVKYGDITIAGQSAPGDGICLKNYNFSIKTDNVIIRFMRFRMGDEALQQDDCLTALRQKNIIIDHCSFSWGTDEVATAYDNENFTMQWCVISESLNNSVHEKGEHGYGGIWGGKGASFHHNLFAHHKSRMPRFCGARYHKQPAAEIVDFSNNVIYNWRSNNTYGGEQGNHNIVNNYYKSGPATGTTQQKRILNPYSPFGRFYVSGNVLEGNESITKNNRLGVIATYPDSCLVDSPIPVEEIKTQDATDAYKDVLDFAGASLIRDCVDQRVVSEVNDGTAQFGVSGDGIIDTQQQVGGWPDLKTYDVKTDTDLDGMPDDWEFAQGLDPDNSEDASQFTLDKYYTNIEVYLNELVKTKYSHE